MFKPHVIYLIASPSNKLYIDRTCNYSSRMNRHKNMSDGCKKLNRSIKKHGWDNFDIIILEDNLTYTKATARETFFIHLFDSVSSGYNILYGGVGLGSGKECPNYGIQHTEEHRTKNADAKKGGKNPNFGIPRTSETCIKISLSQPNRRKIRSFNIKTKEIRVFETVSDAARELNVHSGKICAILNKTVTINKNGTEIVRRQAGGYTFEDFRPDSPDMIYEKQMRGNRAIFRLLDDGSRDEYNSIADAKRIFRGDISRSLRTGGTACGYQWFYV
jgi:predicted GIY-YIG superfamily endonuclease